MDTHDKLFKQHPIKNTQWWRDAGQVAVVCTSDESIIHDPWNRRLSESESRYGKRRTLTKAGKVVGYQLMTSIAGVNLTLKLLRRD